jgi:hypothetical protein
MSTLTSDRPSIPEGTNARARRAELRDVQRGAASLSAQLAIGAACVAAAVLIVLIALDTTPIADDYGDLVQIGHSGVFPYLHSYWVGLTDRYANAVLMVVLIKLFGTAAVHVATLLLVGLLFSFCAVATRLVSGPGSSLSQAAAIGGVAAIAIATATPSLFDTLGWFNAVAIYLAGVVAAVGTLVWMVRLATREQPLRLFDFTVSFVVGVAAAGFTELVGMVIAAGSLLAVANARAISAPGARRRALMRAYAAVGGGAAVGVIVILYGPGSRSRLRFQHGGFDPARIVAAIHANLAWLNTFRWDVLAAAAAGLLLANLRRAAVAPKTARWLVIWCVFLSCVPLLVVDLSTAYAGQTVVAPRTAYVAIAFIAAGVATFSYLLAGAAVGEHPQIKALVVPSAAIAFILATIGLGATAIPVIKAERLRTAAVQARATSIRRQLELHRHSISVAPAPLAIVETSAFDLTFHHHGQYEYVLAGIHAYYDIPASIALRVIPTQPRSYCLNGVVVPWAGVESCEQLRADANA